MISNATQKALNAPAATPAPRLAALLRSRFAGRVARVPGRLLLGLQRLFTLRTFGLGALGLDCRFARRLLRAFGFAGLGFSSFDLAAGLDLAALGSLRRSRCQPFCQPRVGGLGAKLFQRGLSCLGRRLLTLDKIRLLKASHRSRPRSLISILFHQRGRQPTTVASIGPLVSTLCQ